MIKTNQEIRGTALALFLFLGALAGYAEAVPQDLPLVNSETLSPAGVETLSIDYADDTVLIRESETGDIVLKEYMKKDRSQYYARVSRSGGTLTIRRGRRPWFNWSWKARVEIYLPRSFRENIRISMSSGTLWAETDLQDYKTIDVSVSSGSVFYKRLSAETASIRLASGDMDIAGIGGNSFISISSGRLQIGDLSGGEHRIKTTSGRMRIGAIRGNSDIEISSGGIAIERIEGNAAMEIQSGNLQITEIAGTSHRIRSSSGRTRIEKIRGSLDIHASSGSIGIGDFSGEGSFELSSGDISLDMRELTGDLRFRVSSGTIKVNLPRESSFNLDAVTNSGRVSVYEGGKEIIHTSGNSTVLRPIGTSPERTIYARTSSGSVNIDLRN
jgi:DUF4097 and DUF4098 domain-containing protein YvlB